MGQITRYAASERTIKQELSHQLRNTQLVTTVANASLTQIGTTHRYAQTTVAQTLNAAHAIIAATEVRQSLTSEQQAQVAWLTQAYLNQMLVLADNAGTEIIGVFYQQDRLTRR